MSGRLLPRRLPLALVRIGRTWPRTVLFLAVLSWILAALLASRVKIETDILSLVPRDNPVVENFETTIDRFGTVDTLVCVLQLHGYDRRDGDLSFADHFSRELKASKSIEWVEGHMDTSLQLLAPLLDRSLLLMDPVQLEKFLGDLQGEGLDRKASELYSQLIGPQGMAAKDYLRADPFGVLPILTSKLSFDGLGLPVDPESGYVMDPEGRMILILARPIRPAQDLIFDRQLAAELRTIRERATKSWEEEGWEGDAPEIRFTGGYMVTLEDSNLIISDAELGMASALLGVLLLFLLAFRRKAALVYATLPLLTGLALTVIFGILALGRMNSLTSAFGGLLVGLGIDFIIVLYGRYVEERKAGADHREAVDAMGRHTGVGVMLGAVTTAATFYAFLLTDFRGLSELGLLTGTGILLLALTVFLLLPALLSLLQDRPSGARRHVISSFGAEHLTALALRWPRCIVGLVIVVSLFLGWGAFSLRFDDDIQNMRSPDNKAMQLRQEIMLAFGQRFTPMSIRVDGKTETEAMDSARKILAEATELVNAKDLARVESIVSIFPSRESQEAVIEILHRHAGEFEKLRPRFEAALRKNGLNPEMFREGIQHFQRALKQQEIIRLSDLGEGPLSTVIGRFVARAGSVVSVVVRCYPPAGLWRRGAPPALEQVVARHPDAILTGTNVVSSELRKIVWRDAGRASLLGFILVFLLMWADFGSPLPSLLALLPLALGLVWMLGTMALLGQCVNFMNIFVVTMVIGIGVDYAVHLQHRWIESGGDPGAIARTSKAIAVAALTTVVGFGSFVLSHYPGLRSVGSAAILGALATALLSVTLLPVVLRRLRLGGRSCVK